MSVDLDELERLANSATPGPWDRLDEVNSEIVTHGCDEDGAYRYIACCSWTDSDAEYIATANPQAILSLISEHRAQSATIARLEAENARLLDMLSKFSDRHGFIYPDCDCSDCKFHKEVNAALSSNVAPFTGARIETTNAARLR